MSIEKKNVFNYLKDGERELPPSAPGRLGYTKYLHPKENHQRSLNSSPLVTSNSQVCLQRLAPWWTPCCRSHHCSNSTSCEWVHLSKGRLSPASRGHAQAAWAVSREGLAPPLLICRSVTVGEAGESHPALCPRRRRKQGFLAPRPQPQYNSFIPLWACPI